MKGFRHVGRGEFQVLDWPENSGWSVARLWRLFPELVVGKYLVNTSFDSGPLWLSNAERQNGWRMVGMLAHSALICGIDQIPHGQYSEWLVFEHPAPVEVLETMVNYGGFTPIDFGWEEKRERFWEQVAGLRPLHVVADNGGGYLVSSDGCVIDKILSREAGMSGGAAKVS